MENGNGNDVKEKELIAICPICKKQFRNTKDSMIIVSQYLLPSGPGMPPQVSIPKITCLNCGIEFFTIKGLTELKEKLKQAVSGLIIPPSGMKLVK